MTITISNTGDRLLRDGEDFFYLADTVWSIFSNTSLEEWNIYLDHREAEQFNALQISILPILHDTSNTYTGIYPFEADNDGGWDFHNINHAFFDNAEKMVAMACDRGFLPVLVVLWNNYVPGTWANDGTSKYTMPFSAVKPYTEYVVKRFNAYNPIYFISGDTKFENEEVIRYFMESLETVKALAPHALTALHTLGSFHELPDQFVGSDKLDFYTYQSGHHRDGQQLSYLLAQEFLNKPVKRPIINSEPCYEGTGHGNQYGRFNDFDVRKAFWWSVLSGAKAGFTYGAHGLFSWHQKGADFNSEAWSKIPFDWKTALHFQGARDVSYCKWVFEQYALYDINPANELVLTEYPDIRFAMTADRGKFALYVPYSNTVRLNLDLTGFDVDLIVFASRDVLRPKIEVSNGQSCIPMVEYNSDAVIIGRKVERRHV